MSSCRPTGRSHYCCVVQRVSMPPTGRSLCNMFSWLCCSTRFSYRPQGGLLSLFVVQYDVNLCTTFSTALARAVCCPPLGQGGRCPPNRPTLPPSDLGEAFCQRTIGLVANALLGGLPKSVRSTERRVCGYGLESRAPFSRSFPPPLPCPI